MGDINLYSTYVAREAGYVQQYILEQFEFSLGDKSLRLKIRDVGTAHGKVLDYTCTCTVYKNARRSVRIII